MSKLIEGANAISVYIEQDFLGQPTEISLCYGEVVVLQFVTVIDGVETHFSDDVSRLSNEEVDALSERQWDRHATSLTILGEMKDEVIPGVTFIIDDPNALTGDVDENGGIFLWAGGEWSMYLSFVNQMKMGPGE